MYDFFEQMRYYSAKIQQNSEIFIGRQSKGEKEKFRDESNMKR